MSVLVQMFPQLGQMVLFIAENRAVQQDCALASAAAAAGQAAGQPLLQAAAMSEEQVTRRQKAWRLAVLRISPVNKEMLYFLPGRTLSQTKCPVLCFPSFLPNNPKVVIIIMYSISISMICPPQICNFISCCNCCVLIIT